MTSEMSSHIVIRPAEERDAAVWERMRQALWPSEPGEHAHEIAALVGGHRPNREETLIAFDDSGRALGFVELAIRSFAEGCYAGPAAYLEGWFVEESVRRTGVGAALVKASEDWARAQGCTELASDAEPDNHGSLAAHKALGFEEVGRAVCFRKSL
jgi:aminoglycoside 6'-N-acetyltransferase I